ncbi:proton channel OTOP2-like [Polypterus senegalus]
MSQKNMEIPGPSSYQPPVEQLKAETLCSQDTSISAFFNPSVSHEANWHESSGPKTASLLSLLYLIFISLVGVAILLSEMPCHLPHSPRAHGFLMLLMLGTSAWMLCFVLEFRKKKKEQLFQDHHAGASWLKAGLALFALVTLILDCVYFGYQQEILQCTSPLMVAFPLVQAMYTIMQVFFLLSFAKICIQDHCCFHRFGLMHSLATNILLWMNAVLDESSNHLKDLFNELVEECQNQTNITDALSSCSCSSDLCHVYHKAVTYLQPFNIEFSLFSSALLYVMWKNIGRISEHFKIPDQTEHQLRFRINTAFPGLLLGGVVLSATLGCMIASGVLFKAEDTLARSLQTYYIFNLTLLSLMFFASCVGSITHRFKKKPAFTIRTKNIVRHLDITLLISCSCGPMITSVFSMTALFFSAPLGFLSSLNLFFSIFKILQILGQNLFITEALFCVPGKGKEFRETHWNYLESPQSTPQFTNVGVVNEAFENETKCSLTSTSDKNLHLKMAEAKQCQMTLLQNTPCMVTTVPLQTFPLPTGRKGRLTSVRAKIMQNISAFLLLSNIAVWILYSYGTRPHLVSKTERDFYGSILWTMVVNSCQPLGIFYHMHSAASLFEVYCKSLKN